MARRIGVAAVCLAIAGLAITGNVRAQSSRTLRDKMIGSWRLESRTVRTASGGTVRDPVLGAQPSGRLVYDASGSVMLQMMRQDRTQAISSPVNAADAKNPRVVLGYDSYFGTFRVNETSGTVTHHVEGSLFPEDLGKDWERQLAVDGDRLTLGFTSKAPDGDVVRTLVFRRLK